MPQLTFQSIAILVCCSCLLPQSVRAQSIPRPIPIEPQPLPETGPLPPPEELLQPLEPPQSPEQPELEVPGTITVQQFEVRGSTIFGPEALAEVLAPFTDRLITFTELLEAQQAVTQLYLDNGYITSGAFIPPQTLDQGIVVIEVIEGTLEEIEITGLDRLRADYVRSRIERGTRTPLNQNQLLSTLQLLQLNPLIERLSAELSAGSRPGLSRLEIELEEADALALGLTFDNQRSPSVGSFRRLIEVTHSNLTGRGDRLNVTYYNTDGSNTLDDLSYSLPINSRDGTITLSHRRTRSNVIEEPFNQLDIESNSQTYEISYRQPFILTPTTELALGITGSIQDTSTALEGDPFPLSLGADPEGNTRITALRVFQEYTTRNTEEVFAARSQFSLGVGALDATVNQDLPDSQFFAWRGQAQYLRLLGPDTFLILRSDLQLADSALLAQEQFSLGGVYSVRGYRQDALLADNGLLLSAEVEVPILRIPEWNNTVLKLTPFVDWGKIWNNGNLSEVILEKNTLASVGLGLKLLVSDNFTAQLTWGIPLIDLLNTGNTLQEDGIYFSVRYRVAF
ncbi:MAG: ShlB/FhaC/HecB family hemolysin secretion/activation protein [Oscillatoriales cyanobacterium RM2_1_1]|nr:ShlB/FhaC/HecB family hemolysin secretion/activation protein [Oscillatoriales cyanobacterium SM2_3_0]NJO46530.1 ShlB/FhaC/HecB family hemolysin secretion/activation protein [Oscillatoriales cyanobacterium RM2_1_1]